jgi:hypothetical protein
MGLISEFIGFATQDHTVFDAGTVVLLGGPVLIALLALNAAYNAVIVSANGTRRAVRLGVKARHHLAARGGVVAVATTPRPTAANANTTTPTVAGAAYAVKAKRVTSKVG